MASLKLGKMTIDGIISSELICVKNDKFRWDIDDVALSGGVGDENFPLKKRRRQWEHFTADFPPPLSTHLALPLAACMF